MSAFISAHFLVTSYRCLQSAWLWSKGTSNFPLLASLYPSIFFSDVAPFMLHPLHSEANPISISHVLNFMWPYFLHVSLGFWASHGWPCVQLLPSLVSGSVLCAEKQSGYRVTASCSYFSFLLLLPLVFLRHPEGLGSSFSLDHFIEITLITLITLEDSGPSFSSIIWHICYSLSFQCYFFQPEFIILSPSDYCFKKDESNEFKMCGTWMGNR